MYLNLTIINVYDKLKMRMEGGFGLLKSWKLIKLTITIQFNIEDASIFWSVMDIHWERKVMKMKSGRPSNLFIFEVTLA